MVKNYVKLIVALLFATNLTAQNVPNYVPTNGLVGWWPFNEMRMMKVEMGITGQ